MADDAESGNPCKKIKLDKDVDENEDVKSADVKPGELTTQSTNVKDVENIAGDVEPVTNDAKEIEITKDVDTSLAVHANDDAPKDGGGDPESDSDVSVISNMSGLSGEASWRGSSAGPMAWVYRSMEEGIDPRTILRQVIPDDSMIPDVDNLTLWKIVINIVSEPAPREKLTNINTLADVIRLMKECKKIMVLTGAGVSVSCGIPDFRSRNGVYARLAVDFPDLPDPQSMFDIRYFRRDQRPFFKFAKEIYPGQFEPSKCHKFIRMIENHGKLLRNYTQNIDTLEQVAGIKNIIQCHGSFASATCMLCSHKCTGDDIKAQIMDQVIPMCSKCEPQSSLSVMKPDIVFFGESLPEEFHDQMTVDKDDCDLLVVIGSSLKVRPVALIPNSLPPHIPQILINKEPLRNMNFDVELLGDCDTIISELCYQLGEGWSRLANKENPLKEIPVDELLTPPVSPLDMKYESSKPAASDKTGGSVSPNAKSQSATVPSHEDKNNSNSTVKPPAFSTDELGEKHEKDAISDSEGLLMDNGSGYDKPKADTADVKNSDVESESKDSNPVSLNKNCEPVAQAMKTDFAVLKSSEVTEDISESTAGTDFSEPKMDTTETVVSETAEVGQDTEPGTSGIAELRKMWRPNISRLNVAKRLAPCQYCFIPPSRYVFSEAEVFTIVDTDSDSDLDDIDTSCTDRDTTSESAIDTSVNADSSGALIDPTADEEQKHANNSELVVENVTDGDDKIKQTEEETNDLNLVNTQVNGQVISDVPVDSVISKEPDTGVK